MKQETSGAFCLLAAGVLWGTTGTAQTFAPAGYDPLIIGLMRISIGGALLMSLALWRGELSTAGRWPARVTLVSAIAVAAFQFFFFTAVHRTGVAVGTIVGLGSAPISAGVLAYLVRGEKPVRRWWVATALAIAGCSLLVATGRLGPLQIEPVGLLFALGAGSSYALYALTIKQLVEQEKSALAVMAVVGFLGALLLLPLAWGRDFGWLLQPGGLPVVFYLGLFSYAVPMFLFARGLIVTPLATAVTLTLAEPLTAGLLSVVIVGEQLSWQAWCGLGMILCGLVLLTITRKGTRTLAS